MDDKSFLVPIAKDQGPWGNWRLNASNYTLEYYKAGNWWYEVDLEQCSNSAQVLDWIFQVSKKQWLSPTGLADLVKALDAVLDPQARLCSFGKSKKMSKAAIRKLVKEHVA
jgi:hypothetical protein